jgi:hypothetical protein
MIEDAMNGCPAFADFIRVCTNSLMLPLEKREPKFEKANNIDSPINNSKNTLHY